MKYLILIFSILLTISSCSVKKNITEETKQVDIPTTKDSSNKNLSFYQEINKPSKFNSLKINSKVDVRNGNFIPTLDAVIYIENGQKVWMNLVAVILQTARGIATPQGIKGYYKLDKTYIDSDFSYLNKMLNVNFINYNSLQNLLVGKTFLTIDSKESILTQTTEGYNLSTNQDFTSNGKKNSYKISVDYDINYELTHVSLSDINSNTELEIYYSNRILLNEESFPKNVKIIIKGNKTDEILLENTKFDFSTMETPYSVPANYTKTEIK